jgi:type I restriction enzyme S subunit
VTDWRTTTTAELIASGVLEIGDGYRAKNEELSDDGLPFARAQNINGGFRFAGADRYPQSELHRVGAKVSEPGDCVITTKGSVGRVAFVTADVQRFVYSPQLSYWRSRDHKAIAPHFLRYWLQGPEFLAQCAAVKGSTDMADYVNLRDQRKLQITLPSPEEQRRIGDALLAFDNLIENNRRRIARLEQMAQAIYREWFVQFRYPGHEEGELVDSPLGPVPTRFDVAPLSACCNINREQRRPEPDEEIVYIDISALGDRTVALPTPIPGSDAPGRARRLLSDGDIVWSMVRPGRRAHALLVKAQTNWIGSTGLAVISPHGVPPSFVFESVSTSTFSDYLVGKEQGAAYPAVRPIDFEQAQIVVPPEQVLRAFDDVVSPIHGLRWELAGQARAAAQLRDLLLPKLVTGAIDVSKLDLDALLDESVA